MLPIEYIGFLINIASTDDYQDLVTKVKNTLSTVLKSRANFKEHKEIPPKENTFTNTPEKLSIIPNDSGQISISIPVNSRGSLKGFFTATFSESVLTNAVYNFLQFLSELIRIQFTKIELNKALLEQSYSLDTILESLNIGILVTDNNLITQRYNQNFLIMLDIEKNINNLPIETFLSKNIISYFLELRRELDNENFAI